jgi:hypothetical protein
MHWSAYEVFSVLSGLALLACALLPSDFSRPWSVVGGIGFIGYGFFVAGQETGVWVFPVWIFFIPFLVVLYLIVSAMGRSSGPDSESGDRRSDW